MYINRVSLPERENENSGSGSARASPRIPNSDGDGPILKRPKIEPESDTDDHRQVSLHMKTKHNPPHIIINLED